MHEATTDDLPGVHKSIISILWAQMNISPRSFFKKITTEKTHKGCDLPYKKNFCLHSTKYSRETSWEVSPSLAKCTQIIEPTIPQDKLAIVN